MTATQLFTPQVHPTGSVNQYYLSNDALWTEKTGPDYEDNEVRTRRYSWEPCLASADTTHEWERYPVYLGITGGAEPQPYVLKRQDILRLGVHKLDYDPSELVYNIRYLQPPYKYLTRIVVTVPKDAGDAGLASVAGKEKVYLDGVEVGELTLGAGTSDTLYAWIPEETYDYDIKNRKAALTLKGVADAPALLEEFTMYRFEELPLEGQSSPVVEEQIQSDGIKLWSTLNSDGAAINYSLSSPGKVKFEIFDCAGRCVATYEQHGAIGENTFLWDDSETTSGVYFIRLTAPQGSATCKTLLLH